MIKKKKIFKNSPKVKNTKNFFKVHIIANKNYDFGAEVYKKISALPESIKTKKLLRFIQAYNAAGNNFPENVSAEFAVADLPKCLESDFKTFDAESVKNFLEWLNFDLNSVLKRIFGKIFKNKRELQIFHAINSGKALQEIGTKFNVTCERVLQIESKIFHKFLTFYLYTPQDIFYFMRALLDGKNILTFDDAKNFLGDKYAKILFCFLPKLNFTQKIYNYDAELNALLFNFDAAAVIKNLPEIMPESNFYNTIKILAQQNNFPEEILRLKLLKFYKHTGKIFHRNQLTANFKLDYIFKEKFQRGYKIAADADYLNFINYLQETFDCKEKFNQKNLDAKISSIGILCAKEKYIHRDLIQVPPKILTLIKNFIDKSKKNVLSYNEIFEALKNKLIANQIDNPYCLQGVLNLYEFPCTLNKNYLTKNGAVTITEEFNNFIEARGAVTLSEITAQFSFVNGSNISQLKQKCPKIIRIGSKLFLHASRLNLQEKDFADIEKFLRQICRNLPVSSRSLLNLFSEKFSDFINRNEIYSHDKLFGILQYMFKGKFNFKNSYVAPLEIKDLTNKKVLLLHLQDFEKIDIEDVENICEEYGIRYLSENNFIDELRPEFIRVDEFSLMRPEILGIDGEIISEVCKELRAAIVRNGGWQSLKSFSDYEWLPQLEIAWNSFLLESIAELADEKFSVIKTTSTKIFIAEDFSEYDFNSFVLKILLEEQSKQPFQSKAEILDWLHEKGICSKNLPYFLSTEHHINFNAGGELVIE